MACKLSVPQNVLCALVASVYKCVDDESTRYALSHIQIQVDKDFIQAVACDGRVLVRRSVKHNAANPVIAEGAEYFYVHAKLAREIADLPYSVTKPVTLTFTASSDQNTIAEAVVTMEAHKGRNGSKPVTITGEAMPGRYPNWQQVYPFGDVIATMSGTAKDVLGWFEPEQIIKFEQGKRVLLPIDANPVKIEGDFTFAIDPDYVSIVLGWVSSGLETSVDVYRQDKPVLFRVPDVGFEAVIMPCK